MKLHEPPFILRDLKIEVTYRCPLACIHCSSDASQSCEKEMTEENCLRILKEAIDMGIKELAFSGGEPLVWSGLEKAVELAYMGDMRITIYTTGNVPDITHKLSLLKQKGLYRCIFSIFGASKDIHERVTRHAGSFDGTLNAIVYANTIGLETEFHFVPFVDNYKELESIADLSRQYQVSRISILRLVPQGRAVLMKTKMLNKIQNLELKRIIERLRKKGFDIRTGSPYNFLMLNENPKCCSAIDRLIVTPNMNLYPCDAFKQIEAQEIVGTSMLSSLANAGLKECWENSPYLLAIRKYLTTPFEKPCDSCTKLEECLSGCLAQKVLEHGKLNKTYDPMCLMN
jgi:radical SAM protein with 4Fe4S-binding SPASM domain